MRAINLVPADARPGRVNGGKSGGAVYGLLGLLLLAVLAVSLLAMTKRDRLAAEQELASVQQSKDAYTTAAAQYTSFEKATKDATERISTVESLAEARFDWAGSMRDLSRLVPSSARVSELTASVSTDAAVGGSGSTLRGALPVPAITIAGCSASQRTVANLVNQLQAMRRVTNVTLESSKKATAGNADSTACSEYEFDIIVFFAAGKAKSSAQAAPATGTTAVSSSGDAAPTTPEGSN